MTICSFSGIYELKEYAGIRRDCERLMLGDIEETRGYCSDRAADIIISRINKYRADDIHFIDNGNYHYMTKLWTDRLDKDFELLVFDHHTDMQPPALIPYLSCGNWILDAIRENERIKKLWLIGPDEEAFDSIPEPLKKRIEFISQKEAESIETIKRFSQTEKLQGKDLYISIDKDLLSEEELTVNWDQGTMRMDILEEWLKLFINKASVLGVDICGEPDITRDSVDFNNSMRINRRLLDIFEAEKMKSSEKNKKEKTVYNSKERLD